MKYFYILIIFLCSSVLNAQLDTAISNKLTDFTAKISNGYINLHWKIVNPVDVEKVNIEMKKAGSDFYQFLSDVNVLNYDRKEIRDSLINYYYSIRSKPKENGVYFYKIELVDRSNKKISSNEIKVGISEIAEFKLFQNKPNPFNPSTIISYELYSPSNVSLKIYTLNGKQIGVLIDEFQNPGTYRIEFNANDFKDLSSGIYFYKLQTKYSSDIKKMIFTK